MNPIPIHSAAAAAGEMIGGEPEFINVGTSGSVVLMNSVSERISGHPQYQPLSHQ